MEIFRQNTGSSTPIKSIGELKEINSNSAEKLVNKKSESFKDSSITIEDKQKENLGKNSESFSKNPAKIILQPKVSKIVNKIHADVKEKADNNIESNKPVEKINVVLQLKSEQEFSEVKNNILKQGGEINGEFKIGNSLSAEIPSNKVEAISKEADVESIWPDREYTMLLDDSVDMINAPAAWKLNYTGKGVKIAVLDTGIDEDHEMFGNRVIISKAFTGEDHTDDRQGHGTHVAGIAAGSNKSGRYNGVAPDAYLMNAKVLTDSGRGSTSSIIAGINWAADPDNNPATDDGADIISMSLGGAYNDQDGPINKALLQAISRGVVVVIASGNCGNGCNGFFGVTTPGDLKEAITVGAVDASKIRGYYSSYQNFGTYSKPDLMAPGTNILSSLPNNNYGTKTGTSMATPFVAGAAALLLQVNPKATNEDVKALLASNAFDVDAVGRDVETGDGLVDLGKLFVVEEKSEDNITNKTKGLNETLQVENNTLNGPNKTTALQNLSNILKVDFNPRVLIGEKASFKVYLKTESNVSLIIINPEKKTSVLGSNKPNLVHDFIFENTLINGAYTFYVHSAGDNLEQAYTNTFIADKSSKLSNCSQSVLTEVISNYSYLSLEESNGSIPGLSFSCTSIYEGVNELFILNEKRFNIHTALRTFLFQYELPESLKENLINFEGNYLIKLPNEMLWFNGRSLFTLNYNENTNYQGLLKYYLNKYPSNLKEDYESTIANLKDMETNEFFPNINLPSNSIVRDLDISTLDYSPKNITFSNESGEYTITGTCGTDTGGACSTEYQYWTDTSYTNLWQCQDVIWIGTLLCWKQISQNGAWSFCSDMKNANYYCKRQGNDCDADSECGSSLYCKSDSIWTNQGCCYSSESFDGTKCYTPCTEGWLNEYQCNGDTKQRKYRYTDCSTKWFDNYNCNNDDSYGGWSNFCYGSSEEIKKSRTYYNYYCSTGSCTYSTSKEEQHVSYRDDGSYCGDAKSTTCLCKDGEADCDDNTECASNNYCQCNSGWCNLDDWPYGSDHCCPNGQEWRDNACRAVCTEGYTGNKRCYNNNVEQEYRLRTCDLRWDVADNCDSHDDPGAWSAYYCDSSENVMQSRTKKDYYCSTSSLTCAYTQTPDYQTVSNKGDWNYCEKAGQAGCACQENEGDCDPIVFGNECANGYFCAWEWELGDNVKDYCCANGEVWDKDWQSCRQACEITSAYWERTSATEGDSAKLIVTTNSGCNGKTITFAVYEQDAGRGILSLNMTDNLSETEIKEIQLKYGNHLSITELSSGVNASSISDRNLTVQDNSASRNPSSATVYNGRAESWWTAEYNNGDGFSPWNSYYFYTYVGGKTFESSNNLVISNRCTDTDGDGWPQESDCGKQADCNDNNAAIHPYAVEKCDTVDNDCNGQNNENNACCPNGQCDNGENYQTCAKDCSLGIGHPDYCKWKNDLGQKCQRGEWDCDVGFTYNECDANAGLKCNEDWNPLTEDDGCCAKDTEEWDRTNKRCVKYDGQTCGDNSECKSGTCDTGVCKTCNYNSVSKCYNGNISYFHYPCNIRGGVKENCGSKGCINGETYCNECKDDIDCGSGRKCDTNVGKCILKTCEDYNNPVGNTAGECSIWTWSNYKCEQNNPYKCTVFEENGPNCYRKIDTCGPYKTCTKSSFPEPDSAYCKWTCRISAVNWLKDFKPLTRETIPGEPLQYEIVGEGNCAFRTVKLELYEINSVSDILSLSLNETNSSNNRGYESLVDIKNISLLSTSKEVSVIDNFTSQNISLQILDTRIYDIPEYVQLNNENRYVGLWTTRGLNDEIAGENEFELRAHMDDSDKNSQWLKVNRDCHINSVYWMVDGLATANKLIVPLGKQVKIVTEVKGNCNNKVIKYTVYKSGILNILDGALPGPSSYYIQDGTKYYSESLITNWMPSTYNENLKVEAEIINNGHWYWDGSQTSTNELRIESSCTDYDRDNYGTNCLLGPDCNDNNVSINPSATEVCDKVDNDCDGSIDEGTIEQATFNCEQCTYYSIDSGNSCYCNKQCKNGQLCFGTANNDLRCGTATCVETGKFATEAANCCSNRYLLDQKKCVECTTNSDCASGKTCALNQCTTEQCTGDACGGPLKIDSVMNIYPYSIKENDQVSFNVLLKNTGTTYLQNDLDVAIVPIRWQGDVYPGKNFNTADLDPLALSKLNICINNLFAASKKINVAPGTSQNVGFSLKAPGKNTVDLCGNLGNVWDDNFKLIVKLHNNDDIRSFMSLDIGVNELTCNVLDGRTQKCACKSDSDCPADKMCDSSINYGACVPKKTCTFLDGSSADCECTDNTQCSSQYGAAYFCDFRQGYNPCVKRQDECSTIDEYSCRDGNVYRCEQSSGYKIKVLVKTCNFNEYCPSNVNQLKTCISDADYNLIIEDASENTVVYKQIGDFVAVKVDSKYDFSEQIKYDTNAFSYFSGSCKNNIQKGSNVCFLKVEKTGEYNIQFKNDVEKIKVIDKPTNLYLTHKDQLYKRYPDKNGVNLILAKAYERGAKENGIVYDLSLYITEPHPFKSYTINTYPEGYAPTKTSNYYGDKIAELVNNKCNGCKYVTAIGDDFVVPHYRREVNIIKNPGWNWIGFSADIDARYLYEDTSYISKSFTQSDKQIIDIASIDKSFDGKKIKIIVPDRITPEIRASIERLRGVLELKFSPSIQEFSASQVGCMLKPAYLNMLGGSTLIIIGNVSNNHNAYGCFPNIANSLPNDTDSTIFLEPSQWGNKETAVLIDYKPYAIDAFTKVIETEAYKHLKGHGWKVLSDGLLVASIVMIPVTFGASSAAPAIIFAVDVINIGLTAGDIAVGCVNYFETGDNGLVCAISVVPVGASALSKGYKLYKVASVSNKLGIIIGEGEDIFKLVENLEPKAVNLLGDIIKTEDEKTIKAIFYILKNNKAAGADFPIKLLEAAVVSKKLRLIIGGSEDFFRVVRKLPPDAVDELGFIIKNYDDDVVENMFHLLQNNKLGKGTFPYEKDLLKKIAKIMKESIYCVTTGEISATSLCSDILQHALDNLDEIGFKRFITLTDNLMAKGITISTTHAESLVALLKKSTSFGDDILETLSKIPEIHVTGLVDNAVLLIKNENDLVRFFNNIKRISDVAGFEELARKLATYHEDIGFINQVYHLGYLRSQGYNLIKLDHIVKTATQEMEVADSIIRLADGSKVIHEAKGLHNYIKIQKEVIPRTDFVNGLFSSNGKSVIQKIREAQRIADPNDLIQGIKKIKITIPAYAYDDTILLNGKTFLEELRDAAGTVPDFEIEIIKVVK